MQTATTVRTPDGIDLAYVHLSGCGPTVVFLGGHRSDMQGTKALYLEQYCRDRDRAYLRFDYSGHGASGGEFEKGTIGCWAKEAIIVINAIAKGPVVLVGSSMGGWLMLLIALLIPDRVRGLVGISAAPDFTRDLIEQEMTAEERKTLEEEGSVHLCSSFDPAGYTITKNFVEEGNRNLLLDSLIKIKCPVRLLHGMADIEVPWEVGIRLADALTTSDVRVVLQKGGNHRFSEPENLLLLGSVLDEVLRLTN